MASTALIPVSEYLSTSYSPDCDYVDGEVQERNVGEEDHSDLQGQLIELLRRPECKQWIRANPEIRVQVAATRFRVPDVCIRRRSTVSERIVREPPLVCIEVLSPEDRMSRTRERVRDYLNMGVLEVWIFEPQTRSVLVSTGRTTLELTSGELKIPETPLSIPIAEVFAALDDY